MDDRPIGQIIFKSRLLPKSVLMLDRVCAVAVLAYAQVSIAKPIDNNANQFTICGGNYRPGGKNNNQQPLNRLLRRLTKRSKQLQRKTGQVVAAYNADLIMNVDIPTNDTCINEILSVADTCDVRPENLQHDLSDDYRTLFSVYSAFRLVQVEDTKRGFRKSYKTIDRLIKDIICAFHRSLTSFGDLRSHDVQVAPSVDSCAASGYTEMVYRNWLILRRIDTFANQLFVKYDAHKRLSKQKRTN